MLPIVSITPFTLQDFPGRSACILWFTGCNFRCGYCHNPDLASGKGERLDWPSIEKFLLSRSELLDGVVFSGGECCLHPLVVELAQRVQSLGYQVKVDTNGSRPQVVHALLEAEAVSRFAIDFKAPWGRYREVANWGDVELWRESVRAILSRGVPLEIRTTVHADQLDEPTVQQMMEELVDFGYRGDYYLQRFREGETLGGFAKPKRRFDPSLLEPPEGLRLKLRGFAIGMP